MQARVEKLPKNKIKLTISVEPKELISHFKHAYSHAAPTVKIDGFRPGKAPRELIESTVGVTRLLSEGLDMAINKAYIEALEENKLNPINQPSIAINKYPAYGQSEEEIGDGLEFTAEFMVFPEAEIGDYSKIKIEKPKKEEAKEEDVEKILDNLQRQKATFEEVERGAEMGDLAEITFEGFLKKVRMDQMCSKNHPVVLGEKTLIPGFEDEIVGMKKGEKKDFKIKFPKDYHAKDLAGKEAEFNVELLSLKKINKPEIDEAFAASFGQKDAKELREAIKTNLEMEMDKKYQSELEQRVLDKLIPLVKVELADELIDREIDRLVHDYEHQLQHMGMNLESYLKTIKKTTEDLRKDMRPAAEKNIKTGLLLGKVIEEQKIDHDDKEAGAKAVEYLVKELTK
jgi:trigger factor